jgi:hypothetical protein
MINDETMLCKVNGELYFIDFRSRSILWKFEVDQYYQCMDISFNSKFLIFGKSDSSDSLKIFNIEYLKVKNTKTVSCQTRKMKEISIREFIESRGFILKRDYATAWKKKNYPPFEKYGFPFSKLKKIKGSNQRESIQEKKESFDNEGSESISEEDEEISFYDIGVQTDSIRNDNERIEGSLNSSLTEENQELSNSKEKISSNSIEEENEEDEENDEDVESEEYQDDDEDGEEGDDEEEDNEEEDDEEEENSHSQSKSEEEISCYDMGIQTDPTSHDELKIEEEENKKNELEKYSNLLSVMLIRILIKILCLSIMMIKRNTLTPICI